MLRDESNVGETSVPDSLYDAQCMNSQTSDVAGAAETIELRVSLHADLRKYLQPGEQNPRIVRLPRGALVRDLLAAIGVAESEEAEQVTVGVDGVLARHNETLEEDAEVAMFSPMEGG
jgi:molybdopterin converting factor small subunit